MDLLFVTHLISTSRLISQTSYNFNIQLGQETSVWGSPYLQSKCRDTLSWKCEPIQNQVAFSAFIASSLLMRILFRATTIYLKCNHHEVWDHGEHAEGPRICRGMWHAWRMPCPCPSIFHTFQCRVAVPRVYLIGSPWLVTQKCIKWRTRDWTGTQIVADLAIRLLRSLDASYKKRALDTLSLQMFTRVAPGDAVICKLQIHVEVALSCNWSYQWLKTLISIDKNWITFLETHIVVATQCLGMVQRKTKVWHKPFPFYIYNIHVYLYIHIDRWIDIDSDFVALTFDAVQSSKLTKSNVESGLMKKEPRTLAMVWSGKKWLYG